MEGFYMKKISYAKSKELIQNGFPVKALIARNYQPVNNLTDLDNLIQLDKMGVQHCELYYEPEDTKVPDNAYDLSLIEAINLITNDKETICSKISGKEVFFSSSNELISYIKECIINGDPGILYWYVD